MSKTIQQTRIWRLHYFSEMFHMTPQGQQANWEGGFQLLVLPLVCLCVCWLQVEHSLPLVLSK